jgi:enoyl-CoA hydratase/carnithine racemase
MAVIISQVEEGVRLVKLDRADALNAFNSAMMDELCDIFLDAAADVTTKVLVLTGAGRAFSAGADLKAMGQAQAVPKHGLNGMLDAIIDFPKPFIVAANGLGVGIGCTILGLADMAFAAHSARFRCPFSSLGLTAEAASTFTFGRLLGHQKASWILLSSEWVSATQALDVGLVMEIFSDDVFMQQVMDKARIIAELPLTSLMQTKTLMMKPLRDSMKAAVAAESQALASLSGGAANREAVKAFLEKRPADFSAL